jgi:NADH-quinone oxidoreductase subunit J
VAWAGGLVLVVAMATYLLRLGGYDPARLARELTGTGDLPASAVFATAEAARQAGEAQGVVGAVAGPLFTTYLVPFEVTSLLLLTAIIGAVVLAKKRI